MSSQKYTPEFKREVAHLVSEQNYTYLEATEAMGVSQTSLRRWLQQPGREKRGETPLKGKAITAEQQRIQEPEARIRKVERGKKILKKASALFMPDSLNRLI